MTELLIRGGNVISMEPSVGDLPVGDVHVKEGRIDAVAEHLDLSGIEVIDASGCIVTPGFINGHHHAWQSLLRGFSSDWSFPEYMNERARFSGCFDAEAAYVANLLGGLECLAAGVTTVVDHSHLQKSPEISDALARGLLDSGIGGFFCYALQNVTDFLNDQQIDAEAVTDLLTRPADDWHYENAKRVRRQFFDGNTGPLRFGVALGEGTAYASQDEAKRAFERASSLQPALITSHWNALRILGVYKSNLSSLEEAGAFTAPTLLSHNNQLNNSDLELMVKTNIGHCTCPDTESGMGLGKLMARKFAEMGGASSLGIDTTCVIGGFMLEQAHLLLQIERMQQAAEAGEMPKTIGWPTRPVFEMLTSLGARAVGLQNEAGSLAPGKRADLLVIRPNDISAQPMTDPIATLLFYTQNSDIKHVLVNGEFRKRDGVLQGFDLSDVRMRAADALARVRERLTRLPRARFEKAWGKFF